MSEEVIETPTPEAAPEEAPAITPEQVAAFLGIPVEEVDTAKNVGELYKRANNYNREAKAAYDKSTQPQAPAQMTPASDDDPFSAFDEATAKALRAGVEAEAKKLIGPIIYEQQQRKVNELQGAINDFHEAHASESTYSYDTVVNTINELGLDVVMNNPNATASQVKKVLNTAYKFAQASTVDVEKAAEDKAAEIIAQSKAKGEEVVNIKPKRPVPSSATPDLMDPNLTPEQRYALVKAELNKK